MQVTHNLTAHRVSPHCFWSFGAVCSDLSECCKAFWGLERPVALLSRGLPQAFSIAIAVGAAITMRLAWEARSAYYGTSSGNNLRS
jgi:hypothetical protein